MKKSIFFILLLFQINFFSPVLAQVFLPDGGNIKAGSLQIHPSLGVEESYSDNIYQNYGGLLSDSGFITMVSPGVKLNLPIAGHQLYAEYKADFNFYSADSETNYTRQKAGMGSKFNFSRGLDVSLSYDYTISEIPRRSRSGIEAPGDLELFRGRPFFQNDFKGLLGFTFAERWRMEGSYSFFNYRYNNRIDSFGNYDRPLFGAKLFYRFTPKISALGEYNYSTTTYPDDPTYDHKSQMAFLGLSFDPAGKLRGELKVGFEDKQYNQSIVGRKKTFSSLTVATNLTQNFNRYSSLKLILNRAILEDIDSNAPYTENKAGLEFRHIWSRNEKVWSLIKGGYSTLTFEGSTLDIDGSLKNRDDQRLEFGLQIGYDFSRWLTMNLGYQYISNQSNFINYDYLENRGVFSLRASF